MTQALKVVVRLAALAGGGLLFHLPSVAADETKYIQYACTPALQDAGRVEPDPASDLLRWPDGTLRLIDQGSAYYATEIEGVALPEWIDVFGAQAQRGNSEIGFVRSDNLTCAPLQICVAEGAL